MTLSILAYDPDDDVVGAAVTSCVIAAGRRILHVRPGVGAAVAQASSEITWGQDILNHLETGTSAGDAVNAFARNDSQIAAVTFGGDTAAHTGPACEPHRGHEQGHGLSVQVNTARLPNAPHRMIHAFESTPGPLAERLIAALAASGGDARGEQSAGIIISGRNPLGGYADEPHIDLRVDDHRQPVHELQRLLSLHRAHNIMRQLPTDKPDDPISILTDLLITHPGDPHLQRALDRATRA